MRARGQVTFGSPIGLLAESAFRVSHDLGRTTFGTLHGGLFGSVDAGA